MDQVMVGDKGVAGQAGALKMIVEVVADRRINYNRACRGGCGCMFRPSADVWMCEGCTRAKYEAVWRREVYIPAGTGWQVEIYF